RHPRSTLFPYTTLFRSHFRGRLFTGVADQEAVGEVRRHAGQLFYEQPLRDNIKACVRVVRLGYLIRQQETVEARRIVEYGGRCQDRKSTRLNSSHVKTS